MPRATRRAGRWLPGLWLAWAFVTWNVTFDRAVDVAALDFTRQQVVRYGQGHPPASIADAFSPRVGRAALTATAWTLPILVAGLALGITSRRSP